MITGSNTDFLIGRGEMIALAYSRMYAKVCGYVAKRIGNVTEVEDIVQDVFETLLQPGRLLSEDTLDRYIYSIAHNLVIDWYRRHACSIRAQEYFFTHSPVSVEDSETKVQVADIMRVETVALEQAGENARRIYMMFVHGGSSVKDIAKGMMLSERTVENHIFRTRSKVREAIRKAM